MAAENGPDADMLAAAERVARFIASGGTASLSGVFVDDGVAIIENFAPYRFTGPDAVEAWSAGMRAHLAQVTALSHSFGLAQDFSRDGDDAFFSLPTTWRGLAGGVPFSEDGGWAFVLRRRDGAWRVAGYGWSVIALSRG
jgi:hypothetical protein